MHQVTILMMPMMMIEYGELLWMPDFVDHNQKISKSRREEKHANFLFVIFETLLLDCLSMLQYQKYYYDVMQIFAKRDMILYRNRIHFHPVN